MENNFSFPLRLDLKCPECGKTCVLNPTSPIMMVGNVITNPQLEINYRYECPDCEVILAVPVEPENIKSATTVWMIQNQNTLANQMQCDKCAATDSLIVDAPEKSNWKKLCLMCYDEEFI